MQEIKSPCVHRCNYDSDFEICIDCLRTKDEIAKWSTMTNDEKLATLERLKGNI